MSASYRSIARLPLEVFQDLITRPPCHPLIDGRDNDDDNHKKNDDSGCVLLVNKDNGGDGTDNVGDNNREKRKNLNGENNSNNNNNRSSDKSYHTNPRILRQKICQRLKKIPIRYLTNDGTRTRRRRHRSSSFTSSFGGGYGNGGGRSHIHNNNNNNASYNNNHNNHKEHNTTTTTSSSYITTHKVETVGQLLMLSKYTLLLVLDPILTYEEIGIMLSRICFQCTPKPMNVLRLVQQQQQKHQHEHRYPIGEENDNNMYSPSDIDIDSSRMVSKKTKIDHRPIHPNSVIPTGLSELDTLLRGGIRVGTVTEVVGPSGMGKTQLAMQLCIMATKYNGSTVYVDTEKKLRIDRLHEMASYRFHTTKHNNNNNNNNRWQTPMSSSSNGPIPFSYGNDDDVDFGGDSGDGDRGSYLSTSSQQYYNSSSHWSQTSQTAIDAQQRQIQGQNPNDLPGGLGGTDHDSYKHPDEVLSNVTFRRPNDTNELLQMLFSLEGDILHLNNVAAMKTRRTTSTHIQQGNQGNNSTATHPNHDQDGNRQNNDGRGHDNHRSLFPVKLLIVDSIAAPIRRDFGVESAPQRASTVFQCAQILKRLADQLNLAVFVVNQVAADTTAATAANDDNHSSRDPRSFKAALGTSWHHCLSTRLFMEEGLVSSHDHPKSNSTDNDDEYPNGRMGAHKTVSTKNSRAPRKVTIVKSNLVPLAEAGYDISTAGIVERML